MSTVTIPRDGLCVCGLPVARHFDADNRMLGCAGAREGDLQPEGAPRDQASRHLHVVRPPADLGDLIGDPVPELLTKHELARRLRMSCSQVDRHRRRGDHLGIQQIASTGRGTGTRPFFSGRAYKAWRDGGEPRTAPRYFRRGVGGR
jgi:hypothetical protein